MIYLQSIYYNLWKLVIDGPPYPQTVLMVELLKNHLKVMLKMIRRSANKCQSQEHPLLWIKC